MHEGFVNYNAGTLGSSMVEGRISPGVVVGDGSDIGGGPSIMGTLSGGGKEVISIGERCLLGANSGIGISLGDDCVVEAGLLRHRWHQGHHQGQDGKPKVVKAARALGRQQRPVPPQLGDRRGRGRAVARRGHRAQRRRCTPTTDRAGAAPWESFRPLIVLPPSPPSASWRRRGRRLAPGVGPLPDAEGCRAEVGGRRVDLDTEQAENAALITAISVGAVSRRARRLDRPRHGLPGVQAPQPRERRPGLARPLPAAALAGVGNAAEILNPAYAVNAFYDALIRVDGYARPAASPRPHRQSSARPSPTAYANHEEDARALASALTGETGGGAFTCEVRDDYPTASPKLNAEGLTKRANAVRRELLAVFGDLPLGGYRPRRRHHGHMHGSAHYEGRALDVFVRPVSAANRQRGWAIAAYLVAQAERLRSLMSSSTGGSGRRIALGERAGATTRCPATSPAARRSSSIATTSTWTSPPRHRFRLGAWWAAGRPSRVRRRPGLVRHSPKGPATLPDFPHERANSGVQWIN